MNEFILIGRLTKDPEVKYTPTQTAIANVTIAIDGGYGEKKRTDFPRITVYGKTAENLEKFVGKGQKIAVRGRIQTGSYEKDGRTVYTTDLIADQVEYLEFKPKEEEPKPHFDGDIPF